MKQSNLLLYVIRHLSSNQKLILAVEQIYAEFLLQIVRSRFQLTVLVNCKCSI